MLEQSRRPNKDLASERPMWVSHSQENICHLTGREKVEVLHALFEHRSRPEWQ